MPPGKYLANNPYKEGKHEAGNVKHNKIQHNKKTQQPLKIISHPSPAFPVLYLSIALGLLNAWNFHKNSFAAAFAHDSAAFLLPGFLHV